MGVEEMPNLWGWALWAGGRVVIAAGKDSVCLVKANAAALDAQAELLQVAVDVPVRQPLRADISLNSGEEFGMNKITPFLWFDDKAEEAMNYYVSIFKNSKVGSVTRYGDTGPM